MRSCVSALAVTDDEARLDIAQPDIVGPMVSDHLDGVRTPIVRAIDQEAAHIGGAHFGQSYFLGAVEHGPMIAPIGAEVKPLGFGLSPADHTKAVLKRFDADRLQIALCALSTLNARFHR
jgi:hypothetical protein